MFQGANDVDSITNYESPTSRDDQRLDAHIMNLTLPKFQMNPVPQLEDPFLDSIPHDYVNHSEIAEDKPEVYLDNGVSEHNWMGDSSLVSGAANVKVSAKKTSPFEGNLPAQVFVGCISIVGLFMVFKALKL